MKVVLFCGGRGMRLREYTESIPKPLVSVGGRPIIWHVMQYYAHHGHKDFILCLGWKADAIKEYFRTYNDCAQNRSDHLQTDVKDWNISFVDTGVDACIGQRLKATEPLLRNEEVFLANYADGLSDLHLPDLVDIIYDQRSIGVFLSVRPRHNSFHAVDCESNGRVTAIRPIEKRNVWMNGGFFVFDPRIFDYIMPGDELVDRPFERLIAEGELRTMKYEGFWACMDTFKERQLLEDFALENPAPWEVWRHSPQLPRLAPGERRSRRRTTRRLTAPWISTVT